MSVRLKAGIEVSALIRRVDSVGGNAAVLARGDPDAGAILLILAERGETYGLFERALDAGGRYGWARTGPAVTDDKARDSAAIEAYLVRRRAIDSDLWMLELDIPGVERFAAEMIATG